MRRASPRPCDLRFLRRFPTLSSASTVYLSAAVRHSPRSVSQGTRVLARRSLSNASTRANALSARADALTTRARVEIPTRRDATRRTSSPVRDFLTNYTFFEQPDIYLCSFRSFYFLDVAVSLLQRGRRKNRVSQLRLTCGDGPTSVSDK